MHVWLLCKNVFLFVCACVFLVCHLTSVPVQLLQTAAVMCHGEPRAYWPDGLPETAVDCSGGSAHTGYQRIRSEQSSIQNGSRHF